MRFEFDEKKSQSHKQKHGLDFREAQALWADPKLVLIPLVTEDEPRSLFIGRIADKHWSAIVTFRGDRVRIISVRRSRENEIELYES